jgi:hypothetical protein
MNPPRGKPRGMNPRRFKLTISPDRPEMLDNAPHL